MGSFVVGPASNIPAAQAGGCASARDPRATGVALEVAVPYSPGRGSPTSTVPCGTCGCVVGDGGGRAAAADGVADADADGVRRSRLGERKRPKQPAPRSDEAALLEPASETGAGGACVVAAGCGCGCGCGCG
eukprot:Rhum_TRINITY_DN14401_c7_g1::Rhum_TRINITY_DN14401_c7_g1_i1::g.87379::m.87379